MSNPRVLILNTSVLLTPGTYRFESLSLDAARAVVTPSEQVVSAVGHPATAEVLSRDLGAEIANNRLTLTGHAVGQRAIVFKLRERPPTGAELTVNDIDRIGYDLMLLTRLE